MEFIVSPVSAWNTLKGSLARSYGLILVHTELDSYQTWHTEALEASLTRGSKEIDCHHLLKMSQLHLADKTRDLLEQTGLSLNRLLSLLKPFCHLNQSSPCQASSAETMEWQLTLAERGLMSDNR